MALRQLGLFQLNTNPGTQEIDFGTPTYPLDEIFVSTISADTYLGNGSGLTIPGIGSLETKISNEEVVRENADNSLSTKISTDVQVAITNLVDGAPAALDTLVELATKIGEGSISEANIVSEINSVGVRVTNESATRLAADGSLATLIGQVSSEASTELSSEISQTGSEVNSLTTRISSEESVRTTQVTSLANEITGEVTAEFTSVDTRISGVEGDLTSVETRLSTEETSMVNTVNSLATVVSSNIASVGTELSDEETARISADGSLATLLSSELVNRASEDDILDGKITTEATQRGVADNSLADRIVTLENNPYDDSSINSRVGGVEGDASSLDSRISSEEEVRSSADTSITLVVGQNTTNIGSASTSLTTRVSSIENVSSLGDISLNTKIEGESSSRLVQDNSLDAKIDSEISTLKLDVEGNESDLTNEASLRAVADASLATKISSEVITLGLVDTSLHVRISSEEITRGTEDSLLSNEISVQAGLRLDGDTSLLTKFNSDVSDINDNVSSLATGLGDVVTDYLSADTSIDVRVSGLEFNVSEDNSSIAHRVDGHDINIANVIATSANNFTNLDGKIDDEISSEVIARDAAITVAVNDLIDGAGTAYDTLSELQAELLSNDSDITTILTSQGSISTRISNEEVVRGSADTSINVRIGGNVTSIDSKLSVLTSTDVEIIGDISNGVIARDSADLSLTNRIGTEESIRQSTVDAVIASAYNDSSINTRVSSGEDLLDSEISSEASSRVLGDNSLNTKIGQVSTALGTEITTTNSEVTSLHTRIGDEEVVRGGVDISLVGVDTSLHSRISSEEVTRSLAVSSLHTKAGNAIGDISSIDSRVQSEESTRLSSDVVLTGSVGSINTRVQSEESKSTSLSTRVGDVETDLISEVGSVDTRMGNIEAAGYDDSSINTRVGGVESDLTSAEGSLDTKIDSEVSSRVSGDLSLNTKIGSVESNLTTEISSTNSEVISINTRVGDVESDLTGVETSLNTKIGGVSTDIATEAGNRASADTSLTSRINLEEGVRATADASLANLIGNNAANIASHNELSGVSITGDVLKVEGSNQAFTVDLSQFNDNTDNFIIGATLVGDILNLSRQTGSHLTVNLGQYQTSSEVTSQITTAIADFATESYVNSAVAPLAITSAVSAADVSLNTKIDSLDSDLSAEISSRLVSEDFVVSAEMSGDTLKLTKELGGVVTVDLAQFADDTDTDNFVTGASIIGDTLTLTRQNGNVNVNLGQYQTSSEVTSQINTAIAGYATEVYVSNQVNSESSLRATADSSLSTRIDSIDSDIASHNELNGTTFAANVLTVSGTESSYTVDLTSLTTDVNVSSGSYNSANGELTLTKSDGGTVVVSDFYVDVDGDNFITGASMSGQNLVLSRQGLTDITVSLAGFVTSGELTTAISDFKSSSAISTDISSAVASEAGIRGGADVSLNTKIDSIDSELTSEISSRIEAEDFVLTATMSSDVLKLTRAQGGVVSVDLSQFSDDTDTDNYITGASMTGDVLTLTRQNGNVQVNLGQYQTSSEVSSQINTAIADFATESYVGTAISGLAVETAVSAADNSLDTKIDVVSAQIVSETSSRIATEDYVIGAAMSNDTLKLTRALGSVVTVDLGQFKDNTDNYLTGASISGDLLTLSRNSGGSVTVNLGQYQTSSEVASQITSAIANYATTTYVDAADVSLASKIGSVDTRFGGLPSEDYVTGAVMSNDTLKLTRAQGGVVSVDLSRYTTASELTSALSPYATSTVTSTQISSGINTETNRAVGKENSLHTRIGQVSTALGTEIGTTNSEVTSLHTRVGSVSTVAGGNVTTIGNVSTLTGTISSDLAALEASGYNDSSLETRISTEESTRLVKDNSLNTRVGSVSTAIGNEINSTNGDISSLNTRVGNEEGNRVGNDGSLASAISNETTARIAGDANLQSQIDSHNELNGTSFSSNVLTVGGTQSSFSVDLGVLASDVTVTGGTYNSGTQVLNLTKSNGDNVAVSGFAIDTDTDNFADSVAFNSTNGVLTIGRTGTLSDLSVDLDGRYLVDTVDNNNYVDGASFNTTNGVLTIGRSGSLSDINIDLDGRFTDNGYADAMNQHVKTNSAVTFSTVNTGQGATEVHLMNQNLRTTDSPTFNTVNAGLGVLSEVRIDSTTLNGNAGFLTINTDVEITGELRATSKSFLIDHPTQPNMKLQYGNLEGPEHGVYIRGKVGVDGMIELPEYWTELVREDSITVQLTAFGAPTTHFVKSIEDNKVEVGSESGIVNAFYTINAERKDVYKLKVEFPA